LRLNDCIITAAARCAPPGNKPTPQELRNCFPYLVEEFAALDGVRVAIGLGVVGTNAALKMLAARGFVFEKRAFGHGVEIAARKDGRIVTVIASYHPSRQNTNTGVLTTAMFDAIFTRAREILHA
jgi:uracil-DNA glycosylase family 4